MREDGVLDLAPGNAAEYLAEAVLLTGFGYAAWADWRRREVADGLWVLLGIAGLALGLSTALPNGPLAVGLWLLVSGFVLQHFLPWDVWLERRSERLPGAVELAAYVLVSLVVLLGALARGIGATGVSVSVLAAFLSVLLARGLFEARLLYGGADAKALMAAGLLLPMVASPWITPPAAAAGAVSVFPYAVTILMNAALFALAVPIVIAVRNLRHREFEFPQGFLGYTIPVAELPRRFVWLRDPTYRSGPVDEAETSEEDIRIRERQRGELESKGVTRVWVTPQLPFLVLLAAGALAGLVIGNVVFDLLTTV